MKKILIIVGVLVLISLVLVLDYFNLIPKKHYTNEYFNIEDIVSSIDYDNDGVNDYKDIMLGARVYVESKPKYKSAYYAGGYPPEKEGVCTDVIWSAFKESGYNLKDLIDRDIESNMGDYYRAQDGRGDSNINFRRVENLRVFFDKYATSLTLDIYDIAVWQAGDIVIFGDDKHIGIISDKRNKKGIPYIIHNGGQPVYEEDAILKYNITGHYRWDGI